MESTGATWADAVIRLIDFASSDPIKFLLTVPLGFTITGALIFLLWRIFFTGPLAKNMAEFRKKISEITEGQEDE